MTEMHALVHSFITSRRGDLVLDFVLTAILAIIVLGVTRLPRISPRTRHALLLVVLAKFVVPVWAVGAVLKAIGAEVPGALRVVSEAAESGTIWIGLSSQPAAPKAHVACLLVAAWLAVAALLIGIQIIAHLKVRGVARRARPALPGAERILDDVRRRSGCATPVRLSVSSEVGTPCVVRRNGVMCLLPDTISYSEEELEAVFRHEIEHVRRRDPATRAIAGLVVAMNWANPLAWFVRRRLHVEAESACDAEAIAYTKSIDLYLETIRKSILAGRREQAVAGMMGSGLAERLRRMPMLTDGKKSWNHALLLSVCVALAGAFTLAAAAPRSESHAAPDTAPASEGAILSVVSTDIGHYGIFANVREVRPGQMQINVVIKDKETGRIVSAPRIVTEANIPAAVRSGTTVDGIDKEFTANIVVDATGAGEIDLEWREDGVAVEKGTVRFQSGSDAAATYDVFRQPIDLAMRDAKLDDVLRMFGQLSGFAIQAPVDLDAKVSINLHGVPFEEAIDRVLEGTGASWYVEGKTIVIAKMR